MRWNQLLLLAFTPGYPTERVCRASDLDRSLEAWKLPRWCEDVDLSFTPLGPDGMAQLSHILARRPVRNLNLTWSSITLEGVQALTRGIERCPTLIILDISGNWLENLGVLSVITALKRYGTIKQLSLRWNGISREGIPSIASALASLPNLELIDLGGNWLLDAGVADFAQVLKRQSALQKLRLDYTGVGSTGVIHVANAIRKNISLVELDLSGNYIDDSGVGGLAEALRNHTSLRILRMRLNEYFGDIGAAKLALALPSLTQLEVLDLGGNRLSDTGASVIVSAKMGAVIHIQLDDNSPQRHMGHAVQPGISSRFLDRTESRRTEGLAPFAATRVSDPHGRGNLYQAHTSEIEVYWSSVYRSSSSRFSRMPSYTVNFFYDTAPRALMPRGCEQHAWSKCRLDAYFEEGTTPPFIERLSFFSPFRLPPGSCMKSLFEWNASSISSWESSYAYAAGVPDNTWVEVAHTREQTGGAWLYLAAGSGVFWNCGRSLRARNKVHAAIQLLQRRLRMTKGAALNKLALDIERKSIEACDAHHCATFMDIFMSNRTDRNDNCYGRCRSDKPLSEWLERAAYGNGAKEWWYDHMSASSVFDYGIYRWAKQLKYDSIQLTMQPQVWCGLGWTTELLDLRVRPHRIHDVLPHLAVRGDDEGSVIPCIVRSDNISRKAFQICVYCEGTLMERTSRCITDASRGRPKFTIYSQYPRHRFDACFRGLRLG